MAIRQGDPAEPCSAFGASVHCQHRVIAMTFGREESLRQKVRDKGDN